jgi:hypothetical protein
VSKGSEPRVNRWKWGAEELVSVWLVAVMAVCSWNNLVAMLAQDEKRMGDEGLAVAV